jgi:sec-independent protein translocase protein TatA
MFGLKAPELLIICVVLVLLFGTKKLPELGKGLGGAIRDFKRAISNEGLLEPAPVPVPAPAPVAVLQRVEQPAAVETVAPAAVVVETPQRLS